jgi:hypothetical protein
MLKGFEDPDETYTVLLSLGQATGPVFKTPVKLGVGDTLVVVAEVGVTGVAVVDALELGVL